MKAQDYPPGNYIAYSVLGKGKSSSKGPSKGDMLVTRRVSLDFASEEHPNPSSWSSPFTPPFWARLQKGSHGDAAEDLGLDMKSFAEVGTTWN